MKPEHFQKLAEANLTVEQIGVVMQIMAEAEEAMKAAEEARKAVARERVQRWRDKKKNGVTLPKHNGDATLRLTRAEDSSSNSKISEKEEKKISAPAARGDLADFKAELSSILDPERIEAIVAVRRKKGATMTGNTGRLLVAAIQRCHLPASEVADEMALRNWTSVKPDWLEKRTTGPPGKLTPSDANRILTEMEHERQAQRNHEIAGILPPDGGQLRRVDSLVRGAVNRPFD